MPRRADVMLASEHAETQQDGVLDGIDLYSLPQSTVVKVAKAALPPTAKLQKESVLALVKGSTVFINYIAAAAQEVASARGHKTITSADVLQALELTNFGDMLPSLNTELEEYRNRLGKNTTTKKAPAAATVQSSKGKGRSSTGKASTGAENGKESKETQATDDEEPYSEPDVPDGDDIDLIEDDEVLGAEEEGEESQAAEAVDQMDLDDSEMVADARALDEREKESQ